MVELVDTPAWGAGPDYGVQVQVLSWAQIWITTLCNRPSIIVTYISGQDLVAAKIGTSRKRPIRLSVYTIHIIWEVSSAGSEHLPYKQGVTGSNPVLPTKESSSNTD